MLTEDLFANGEYVFGVDLFLYSSPLSTKLRKQYLTNLFHVFLPINPQDLEREWWQIKGQGFLLEAKKQEIMIKILNFRSDFRVSCVCTQNLDAC